jgi:hypothetical protein
MLSLSRAMDPSSFYMPLKRQKNPHPFLVAKIKKGLILVYWKLKRLVCFVPFLFIPATLFIYIKKWQVCVKLVATLNKIAGRFA